MDLFGVFRYSRVGVSRNPVKGREQECGTLSRVASLEGHSTNCTQQWCRYPQGWMLVRSADGAEMWAPRRCRVCEGCVTNHRARVMVRIDQGVKLSGGRCAMLTLTSLPGTTPAAMMRSWHRMLAWLKRRMTGLEYAAVKQFGKTTGMLHLHVVCVGWEYVDQAELSQQWKRCSGAAVVDIRRKDGQQAAKYVSRYVSRTVQGVDLRKCVTYSQGFPKLPVREAQWRVVGRMDRGVPPGPFVGVVGGCLVVKRGAGGDLEEVRELGLDGNLFLQRMERGPPGGDG